MVGNAHQGTDRQRTGADRQSEVARSERLASGQAVLGDRGMSGNDGGRFLADKQPGGGDRDERGDDREDTDRRPPALFVDQQLGYRYRDRGGDGRYPAEDEAEREATIAVEPAIDDFCVDDRPGHRPPEADDDSDEVQRRDRSVHRRQSEKSRAPDCETERQDTPRAVTIDHSADKGSGQRGGQADDQGRLREDGQTPAKIS